MSDIVRGDFIVTTPSVWSFQNSVGFRFLESGTFTPSSLTCMGRIEASFTDNAGRQAGVFGGANQGAAVVKFGSTGVLSVATDGTDTMATGVELQGQGSKFYNRGLIETVSASDAAGVVLDGAQFHGSNRNFISATADRDAVGVELDGNGGFINNGGIRAYGGAGATGVLIEGRGVIFINKGAGIGAFDRDAGGAPDGLVGIHVVADRQSSSIIINRAAISSTDTAVLVEGRLSSVVVFNNYGAVYGDLRMNGQAEVFNHGLIVGDVDLGDGNGLFGNDHHQTVGVVSGGGGRDMLVGGHSSETFFGDGPAEGARDGADTLRGGGGADHLAGGGGKDVIIGGRGADVLTGGSGADLFLFMDVGESHRHGLADLITDLQAKDVIDLSAMDANLTLSGDQAFTRVATLDGHAGQMVVHYDAAADRTVIKADVDGDAHADMVILLQGDHTHFTGFVL